MTHTWDGHGTLIRLGAENVEPGEEFEPTEAEKQHLGDQLEPADEDANPGDDGGETGGTDADDGETAEADSPEDTPLSEKHWRTAVTEVEDGEHDDTLAELAESGDLSDSVQEAVEQRQAELAE